MSNLLRRKGAQPPSVEPSAVDGRDVLLSLNRRGAASRQPSPQADQPVRARRLRSQARPQGRARPERDTGAAGAGQGETGLMPANRRRPLAGQAGQYGRDKREGSLARQEQISRGNTRLGRAQAAEPERAAPERDAKAPSEQRGPSPRMTALRARLSAAGSALGHWALVLGGVALLALLCAGVYRGSLWIYGEALTSDFFRTRHIDVTGNVRLSRDMILDIGGLREGINSFAVGIADVERNLRATPWVEDVSVKRLLPDRFVIRVTERMPSFWVRREGRLFYANDRGVPIAPVEGENFLSLPVLTIAEGSEEAIPFLARLMKDMRSGILPIESGAIASVDVSPARGVEIYLEDREMRVSLAPDDWEGNLRRLGIAISDLARKRELGGVLEIRATGNSVYVRKRQGTSL